MSTTPLTDAINSLTTYANETTGASDQTLSDAVATLIAGYGGGGGGCDPTHWARPSDWPDYSKLDISQEEAIYYTYTPNTLNSYVSLNITATGTYTVQVGTLENGVYTALSTDTLSSSGIYYKELTGYATDYVVVRVAGTITKIQFSNYTGTASIVTKPAQTCIEVFGRLPNARDMTDFARQMGRLESVTLKDMASVTTLQRFGAETKMLKNVDISGIANIVPAYLAFSTAEGLKYLYLHGIKLRDVSSLLNGAKMLEYTDYETWEVSVTQGMNSVFSSTKLRKLDLSSWNVTASAINSIFQDCIYLEEVDIHTWTITGGSANNAFRNTALRTVPAADYSNITNSNYMFYTSAVAGDFTIPTTSATQLNHVTNGCPYIKKLTVPANYTSIVASAFGGMAYCEEIHFLRTTPPTLANSNAFPSSLLKIYVPYSADHSILTAYQTAANWSNVASKIVEEPQ